MKYCITKIVSCIFFLSFFRLFPLVAQQSSGPIDITFNNITTEQGLSQNSVTSITKDKKGFIWIGTSIGLNRFDGYEFKNYLFSSEDTNSISSNSILAIYCDSKGELWISTRNGLNLYVPEKDNFERIYFTGSGYSNSTRIVKEVRNNQLWVGTLGGGLFKYDVERKLYEQFYMEEGEENSVYSNFISDLEVDNSGNLWISYINGALGKLEITSGNFNHFIYNDSEVYSNLFHPYRGKMLLLNDTIWICNYPDGLLNFSIRSGKFSRYKIKDDGTGLANNDVMCIMPFDEDYFWVAVDHGGLNLVNKGKQEVFYYKNDPLNHYSISNNQPLVIYKDDLDIYWTGNYRGGVNVFTTKFYKFTNYLQDGSKGSLSARSVLEIYQDSKDRIWVGTDGGGMNLLDPEMGVLKVYNTRPSKKSERSSDVVTSICEDDEGNIWAGTFYDGITVFNLAADKTIHYGPLEKGNYYIGSATIYSIIKDKIGDIWVCTLNGGLLKKKKESDAFQSIAELGGVNLININPANIFQDSRGRLWIGYDYSGLYVYDPAVNTISVYSNIPNNDKSLSSNNVNFVFEDSEKRIWVGTQNGLNLFSENENAFTRIDVTTIFPTYIFNTMLEDNKGIFWIGTIKGLLKYNLKTGNIRFYDYTDNIQGNEFNRNASLEATDGKFYFGGVNGITGFFPEEIVENKTIPPIEITGFYINNKSVSLSDYSSSDKGDKTINHRIELNYKQNFIGFKYAVLNYLHTEKDQYAYYLEPIEKDWNYVGNIRLATYAHLRPGKYIFHVKGSNHDLIWNETGKSIEIIIKPPIWMTGWFKAVLVILAICLVYMIYSLRVRNIHAQKILLEKMVNEQTSEIKDVNTRLVNQTNELNDKNFILEERQQKIEKQTLELKIQADILEVANKELEELNKTKDKFFSIIAHDLKSPFSSILGFSELMKHKGNILSEDEKNLFIDSIYTSSKKIYSLLENLLQWARTQTKQIRFKPEKFYLQKLFDEVISLSMENARVKNITIEINVDNILVYADYDMINTVLRNLLSNAIKFTKNDGRIIITSAVKDNMVVLAVKDSGVGIPPGTLANLFNITRNASTPGTNEESGTGLGLFICKEFVERNGGEISVESTIDKGSTFCFSVPCLKDKKNT